MVAQLNSDILEIIIQRAQALDQSEQTWQRCLALSAASPSLRERLGPTVFERLDLQPRRLEPLSLAWKRMSRYSECCAANCEPAQVKT